MYRRWLTDIDQDRAANFYFAEISSNAFSFRALKIPAPRICPFLSASLLPPFSSAHPIPHPTRLPRYKYLYLFRFSRSWKGQISVFSRLDLKQMRNKCVRSDGREGGAVAVAARKVSEPKLTSETIPPTTLKNFADPSIRKFIVKVIVPFPPSHPHPSCPLPPSLFPSRMRFHLS